PEFYKRLIALLVDIVVEVFYIIIANKVFRSIAESSGGGADREYNLYGVWLLMLLPVFLYHLVMEITTNGQSIGKKIMKIRVISENGGRASISQFLIRWFLRLSDVWIVMLIIILASNPDFGRNLEFTFIILGAFAFLVTDISLVVTSKKSQRIGDILAHTILINTQTRSSIEDTVFQEVAENYIPTFREIMMLSDRDINAIKSILETAKKKGDIRMA